jgi:hypothetical protein
MTALRLNEDEPFPRIGMWYCRCCIEDLYRIDTEADAENLREQASEDFEGPAPILFDNLEQGIRWCLEDGEWARERAVERFGADVVLRAASGVDAGAAGAQQTGTAK